MWNKLATFKKSSFHVSSSIRRLEDATGLDFRTPGFPSEMLDDEPEEPGYEVIPQNRESP